MIVRVCKDCGTIYSEKTERCENCGTRLSEPMENEDAVKKSDGIVKEKETKMAAMADRRNHDEAGELKDKYPDITMGPARIISGVLALIELLCCIGCWVWFYSLTEDKPLNYTSLLITVACFLVLLVIVIDRFIPKVLWFIFYRDPRTYEGIVPGASDEEGEAILAFSGCALCAVGLFLAVRIVL